MDQIGVPDQRIPFLGKKGFLLLTFLNALLFQVTTVSFVAFEAVFWRKVIFPAWRKGEIFVSMTAYVVDQFSGANGDIFERYPRGSKVQWRINYYIRRILVHTLLAAIGKK